MTSPRPDPRPALLAWSGGKDAAWALHVLRQAGQVQVLALLSTIDAAQGAASLQGVRREVLHAQAAAAGLPLLEVELPSQCPDAAYEAALAQALHAARLRWPGLDTVAYGDLFLQDIRDWRERTLRRIGWNLLTPLFGEDTLALATRMVEAGLRARLCCVDTTQLDARFCGREFDAGLVAALPAGIDPCGENGEFHTCAWDGPMFRWPLSLRQVGNARHDGRFARADFGLRAG